MNMKRGQVTIFIIIAIVIVGSIVLVLVSRGGEILKIGEAQEKNPESFLSSCLKDKIEEGINLVSIHGGSIEPTLKKTFQFEGEPSRDIAFLCYTNNYYIPCINQEPMLIQHIKEELKSYLSLDVESCYNKLVSGLESQGFQTDSEYGGFEIGLEERRVVVKINARLTLTKSGETSNYEELNIAVLSKLYDIALLAHEISNQEASYCNFGYANYMIENPVWEIDQFRTSDSIIIYTIKNKDDENKFRFAVRGCVIRPGM